MKYKPEKIDAVLAIKNDAIVSQKADGSIEFIDKNPTNITDKQIEDKLVELNEEFTKMGYQRSRALEYPSIQECVHAILDDDLTALQEKRQAIKTKYPKS